MSVELRLYQPKVKVDMSSLPTQMNEQSYRVDDLMTSHSLFKRLEMDSSASANNPSQLDVQRSNAVRAKLRKALDNGDTEELIKLLPLISRCLLPLSHTTKRAQAQFCHFDSDAAVKEKDGLLKRLMEDGIPNRSPYPLIVSAILNNSVESIRILVSMGVDLNVRPGKPTHHPPLLIAAAKGASAQTIDCLLDLGASVDSRSSCQQNNALHSACSFCEEETAVALYERGVDFNARNDLGETPLCKLLQKVTKSQHDFGNRGRIDLASKLMARGFMLPPRALVCKCSLIKRKSNAHRKGKENAGFDSQRTPMKTDPLSAHRCNVHFSLSKVDKQERSKTKCAACLVKGKGRHAFSEEEELAFEDNVFPSGEDRMHRRYWEIMRRLRSSLSLQEHCRLVILRNIMLGPSLTAPAVEKLALPRPVKRFLINRDW